MRDKHIAFLILALFSVTGTLFEVRDTPRTFLTYQYGLYQGKKTITMYYYNSNGVNYKLTLYGGLPAKESDTISWLENNSKRFQLSPIQPYPLPNTDCGLLGINLKNRIVGGQKISVVFRPWQVALSRKDSMKPFCGGSLIGARYVLTAAHCLKSAHSVRKVNSFVVVAGVTLYTSQGQQVNISKTYIHKYYDPWTARNDIAILQLEKDLEYTMKSFPVCLPPKNALYKPGSICAISGWGVTEQGQKENSISLRTAAIEIISESDCLKSYENLKKVNITKGNFCAGNLMEGGLDACQGDSGGPLTCKDKGRYFLYGITSMGEGCGRKEYPGVYTKVGKYLQWIINTVEISLGNKQLYDDGAEIDTV